MSKIAKGGNMTSPLIAKFAAKLLAARGDLARANENRTSIEARRLAAEQEGPLEIEKLEVEVSAARRKQGHHLRRLSDLESQAARAGYRDDASELPKAIPPGPLH